jgi:hypothetical protein
MKDHPGVMLITLNDLLAQGVTYNSSTIELTIQGGRFKRDLSLKKFFRQVVLDHCQRKLKEGRFCLIVEDEDYLTVWQTEKASVAPTTPGTDDLSAQQPGTTFLTAQQVPLKIEPGFVARCQEALSYYVGAIAERYVQEVLEQFPNITSRQLVDQLGTKISDAQQAEEFWQRVLTIVTTSSVQPAATLQPDSQSQPPKLATMSSQTPRPESNLISQPPKRFYRGVAY